MLTRKQFELLVYINDYLNRHGVSPSFDEMKDALDLKSKSGIHRLITGLEERGFIRRLRHRARALEVLRLPNDAGIDSAAAPEEDGGFSANVIQGNFRNGLPGKPVDTTAETVQLPLYGKIAAGTPIEALRDNSNLVDVPHAMIGRGDHFALTVEGDSMVEAGILDGDTVVIQQCDTADNGTIVVALVEENEVTLKRLRRKGAAIALEPANKKYETRIFRPEQVKIQGKLVGLLRQF